MRKSGFEQSMIWYIWISNEKVRFWIVYDLIYLNFEWESLILNSLWSDISELWMRKSIFKYSMIYHIGTSNEKVYFWVLYDLPYRNFEWESLVLISLWSPVSKLRIESLILSILWCPILKFWKLFQDVQAMSDLCSVMLDIWQSSFLSTPFSERALNVRTVLRFHLILPLIFIFYLARRTGFTITTHASITNHVTLQWNQCDVKSPIKWIPKLK